MPKVGGEHTETIGISGSGRTWTFKSNFSVHDPENIGIAEAMGSKNNVIVMHGLAVSNNGDQSALFLSGENTRVEIAKDGRLRGDGSAIISHGEGVEIINHGLIRAVAGYTAVDLNGINAEIHNFATIDGITRLNGDKGLAVNEKNGVMQSEETVVSLGDGTRLVNRGRIENLNGDSAISGDEGDSTVINHGKIIGSMALGDGEDKLDNRHGKMTGNYVGQTGDDVLITSKASDKLTEFAGEGDDTVKSTVTYTLTGNVEHLFLLGKKDIDAKGNNEVYNELRGNSGNNTLSGYGGTDYLDGKAGNDALKGGTESDVFRFATGYDKDTIHDFGLGDHIQLDDWKAIKNFNAVKNHADDHGDNVWITAGEDILVIRGMNKADLNADYFDF